MSEIASMHAVTCWSLPGRPDNEALRAPGYGMAFQACDDTIRSRACAAPARILLARATFAATVAATGRRGHGRSGTDRVGGCIKRAGQVLSSYVQHDARPRRGRLCRTCAAALDMMQDVALRQRTRTDAAAERS